MHLDVVDRYLFNLIFFLEKKKNLHVYWTHFYMYN